jgi:hypothetical protein
MKCPRCRGYVFATKDGWGVAFRCLHCGWERDVAGEAEAAASGATPQAADGGPPPLWETYCTAFPWEDWVRLSLSGKAYKRGTYGEGRLRLRGPGRAGG